jgi:DUF1009 family protein
MSVSPEPLPSTLGLIAGEGRFPFLVQEEARRLGIRLVSLLIEGEADPALAEGEPGAFHHVGLGELSRTVAILREAGVSKAVLAGRVRHVKAFQILRPDRLSLKVLGRLSSRSTAEILKTVADVLEEEGVTLLDSTLLLKNEMAIEGAMSKRKPTKEDRENVRFGLEMARGIAALDVGQTVVVKKKAVVAAEAMEGTDATIRRAAGIAKGPFVVVKVARPRQDMRFDVPVVGPSTIDSMVAAGATVLGLEAGRVLLLDRKELLRRANEARIAVFGMAHE